MHRDMVEQAARFNIEVLDQSQPEDSGLCAAGLRGHEDDLRALVQAVGLDKRQVRVETGRVVEGKVVEAWVPPYPAPPGWGLDSIDGGGFPKFASSSYKGPFSDGRFNLKSTGKGVHIFVLDSGIRVSHEQFGGRAVLAADFVRGYGACNGQSDCASDDNGHGTNVAGVAGARDYGVAPGAKLHAVKVMKSNKGVNTKDFEKGIQWAASHSAKLKVAILSFTAHGKNPKSLNSWNRLITAVEKATDNGLIVVTAAGNDSGDACLSAPASSPKAITVGATTNRGKMNPASAYGKCVDLLAPGDRISTTSKNNDEDITHLAGGTSLAAPYVAGAAALLLERRGKQIELNAMKRLILRATDPDMVEMRDKDSDTPNLHLNLEEQN